MGKPAWIGLRSKHLPDIRVCREICFNAEEKSLLPDGFDANSNRICGLLALESSASSLPVSVPGQASVQIKDNVPSLFTHCV